MTERLPSPEFSETEQAVIAKLREKGPNDPEAHEMFLAWYREEEAKAESVTETGAAARASIELELKKARLYRAAGRHETAWETLEAARLFAHNEGAEDLYNQAMAIMDEIDAELGKDR